MTESGCIFCSVVAGSDRAYVVWQDAGHLAFLDINPITSGHVLLVPRAHAPWVDGLSPDAHARLFARVRDLAPSVAMAAGAPHTGIIVEGYGIAHAHVHLVPIWHRGDLDPCRHAPASERDLWAAAERLRAVLTSRS